MSTHIARTGDLGTHSLVRRRLLRCTASFLALPALNTFACTCTPLRTVRENSGRRVLSVGAGKPFSTPSAAATVAIDGDVVEIEPGTYRGDAAVWRANGLVIRAARDRVHLHADGAHAEGKAIWVVKGDGNTLEGIAFNGCRVPDGNGAGIRQEGAGLHLRDCLFQDNEAGLLAGSRPDSDILIEHCEFGRNGRDDGYTHNVYVGAIRSLTVRYSYLHRALGGHCLKSRAARTIVACNRIADELDGRSSYEIECPNGGLAVVIGNVIQQGPGAQNRILVCYGVEGLTHPTNELHAAHNTLVNEHPAGGTFFQIAPGTAIAVLSNNVHSGNGRTSTGPVMERATKQVRREAFVAPDAGDYRLKSATDDLRRIAAAGTVAGTSLAPCTEYLHPRGCRARATRTAGAHEPVKPA